MPEKVYRTCHKSRTPPRFEIFPQYSGTVLADDKFEYAEVFGNQIYELFGVRFMGDFALLLSPIFVP